MGEIDLIVYVIVTIFGAALASYLGYSEAKKTEPKTEFSFVSFIESMIRAIPGIITASTALAVVGLNFQGLMAALVAGAGSDVVLKRTWRTITTNNPTAATLTNNAVTQYVKFKAHLAFLFGRC